MSDYINNKSFEKLIIEFQKNPDDEQLKHEVASNFYLLSDNIVRAFKFKLIDKEDAMQEGVLVCFTKLEKFNPERGKAFNWFTTIILNHFRQLYRSKKNEILLKKRFLERQLIDQKTDVFEGESQHFAENVSSRIRRNIEQY